MLKNVKLWSRQRLLVVAAILVALLAAGCGPAPLGTSWAGLRLVGDEQYILVAFNDRLVMVDPVEGETLPLRNQEGEVRLDDEGNPRLWDIRQGPNSFFSAPLLLDDNRLLAASYNQMLFEIDIPTARIENGTGTPIPEKIGHLVADLQASEDLVYAALSNQDVVALDSTDLSVQWTADTSLGVWAKPLLHEGVLYFGSLDHNLYAVDAETGETLWTLDLQGAVPSAPVFANGRLFIGSFARKLFEVSLSGEILSEYTTLDWVWGAPVVADGILYAADLAGNVYALDTAEGLEQLWQVKAASAAIRPSPLVAGDYVLVASRDQRLYWLDREDGSPVMDDEGRPLVREMQSPIFSDLLLIQPNEQTDISEPQVIVSTLSPAQMLVAYTLDEGRFLWNYSFQ